MQNKELQNTANISFLFTTRYLLSSRFFPPSPIQVLFRFINVLGLFPVEPLVPG